jgi:lipoprotein-anchoring transpeptidase ErfK/SrfK
MPPFDSIKSAARPIESQKGPEPEELKKGKEDLKKILAKLIEKEKEIELSNDTAERKSERYAKIAEVLKTQVTPVLQSWLTKYPERKEGITKALTQIEALVKKYEKKSEELAKSKEKREEVKKTIEPAVAPIKAELPKNPQPTKSPVSIAAPETLGILGSPKLNFTPDEERRLKSYYEYNAAHFSDNNLNRTYPNRLQDHEFFIQAVMHPEYPGDEVKKVYKNYNEAMPGIQSLHDELFPTAEYKPFFIDIGPGIANKDMMVMGGKGKPAITSQEMADRFPSMPVVALDLPDQVEIFMGRAQGVDNKKRKYTIDKKDREEMLSRENIHVLSGDGLKSLKDQWADSSTNPIPERPHPQISSNHVLFIRAANSTDIYCSWEDNKKAIEQMSKDFPGNAIVFFFNKEILYKKRNSSEWSIIGQVSDWGFNHKGRTLSRRGKPPFELKANSKQVEKSKIPGKTEKYLTEQESAEVTYRFRSELNKLSEKMQNGDTAILVDGSGQNLFVVKKENGRLSVATSYKVSTGKRGFSPSGGNGVTPLGLFRIDAMPKGSKGQVIATGSTKNKYFKDLQDASDNHGKAVMTTAALHLEGEERKNRVYFDFRIHGTNYESRLGRQASGGCVRTGNEDILKIYEFAQAQKETGRELYVYITNRNPYEEKRHQYAQN